MNGKRNGKGREYGYDNTLEFEGDYYNGKKWSGKGYDRNGNIIYELKNGKGLIRRYLRNDLLYEYEYLKGEKNGKGREYHSDNKLSFEGEYFNGKKWNGKSYYRNGNIIYVLKNGKGLVRGYLDDNLLYEYEYINGERNGKGKNYDYFIDSQYGGEYLNDQRSGKGKECDIFEDLLFEYIIKKEKEENIMMEN